MSALLIKTHIEAYQRDGFTHVPGFFDATELEPLWPFEIVRPDSRAYRLPCIARRLRRSGQECTFEWLDAASKAAIL